jgi:prepilin-type N-terminal cleavage/methylation domain-containing protein
MSNRKGFTLIELLIVVVIIGILAAIAIPKFASTKEKAYISAMKSDLRNLATAQEAWFADNTAYFGGAAITTLAPFPAGCTPGGANPCIYTPSVGVTVTPVAAAGGWSATANHAQAPARNCAIFVGVAAVAPATVEGEPRCN